MTGAEFPLKLMAEMINQNPPEKTLVVVRLTTSSWNDSNGIHIKRTLRYLLRQCKGYNFIHEDCNMIGAKEVIPRIINLDECDDGIYQVVTCNEDSCWETPHIIEDYDYKLIPYAKQ